MKYLTSLSLTEKLINIFAQGNITFAQICDLLNIYELSPAYAMLDVNEIRDSFLMFYRMKGKDIDEEKFFPFYTLTPKQVMEIETLSTKIPKSYILKQYCLSIKEYNIIVNGDFIMPYKVSDAGLVINGELEEVKRHVHIGLPGYFITIDAFDERKNIRQTEKPIETGKMLAHWESTPPLKAFDDFIAVNCGRFTFDDFYNEYEKLLSALKGVGAYRIEDLFPQRRDMMSDGEVRALRLLRLEGMETKYLRFFYRRKDQVLLWAINHITYSHVK